ncbi:hypothetical protein FS837_012958 [Tulasnella sp. UAMH 9824]|nr:hypothetical protein FS837_012958 [Tulasnella sp. UAMH 9824]
MITVARYPLDIPQGTSVPAWAYQDVSLIDRWNQTLALPQISVAPESTYYGTPTASISYNVRTAGGVANHTGAANATTSYESSEAKAGRIAGGVVGLVSVVAFVVLLAWLLIPCSQNEAQVPSPTAHCTNEGGQMGEASNLPAAVDYGNSYPTSSPTIFSGSRGTPNTPKLYDPDDPSTFPQTPAPLAYQSTDLADTATSTDHGSPPVGR